MTNNLKQFLLKDKPFNAFLTISQEENQPHIASIQQQVDTTYAHLTKTVNQLEELGLITRRKEGRKKIISLTDEGEKLGKAVEQFHRTLEEVDKK